MELSCIVDLSFLFPPVQIADTDKKFKLSQGGK